MRRIGVTLLLCVGLLAVGFTAPAAGAAAPAAPARMETVDASSEPTEAPFAFSMVGMSVPRGASAALRTSVDGESWSEWVPAEMPLDEGPDGTVVDTSAPLWVGAASYVQTRVTGAASEAVEVHLIDSAGLSRSFPQRLGDALRAAWSGTPPSAVAAVDQPPIRSRAEWGADENGVDNPAIARRARLGFVHHTAGSNDYAPEDVPAILRGSQAYHMNVRGWGDIGYNLLVDRFGTIWEGRAGGVDAAVIGAQAGGFNTGSFGVSMIGDFSGARPSPAAVDALTRLLAWKFDVHHIDVTAQVDVRSGGSTRFPAGQLVRLSTLSGHRDVSTTTCPASVYDLLPDLRQRVASMQGPVLVDHAATPAGVRVVRGASIDGAIAFSTRLRPAGPWRLEVRGPDGGLVHADQGDGEIASSAWSPTGVARGIYSYQFAADGRRAAADTLALRAPEVTGIDIPDAVRAAEGGTAEAVGFRASLWPGAQWALEVRDADGAEVFSASGSGETLDTTWDGGGADPGAYAWSITADDVAPVTGSLQVVRVALQRLGTAGDPIADAVELSRAAFSSEGEARRAIVARADVFADTMAGGPLAGEDGPLLLTGSDALDERALAELERVLPDDGTVYVLGGEEALAPAVVEAIDDRFEVIRIGGAGRAETAALVAAEVIGRSGARSALVARASGGFSPWADALAGGAYGAEQGIPVLLTETAELSAAAADAIADLGITETVVLGGVEAVSESVAQSLPGVRRVGGVDRAATAAAIARELWGVAEGADGDRMLLAGAYREDAWTLALAATPLAARNDAPLYVTDATGLPAATADALRALGYGADRRASGWVLGGDVQVSPAVVDSVSSLLG